VGAGDVVRETGIATPAGHESLKGSDPEGLWKVGRRFLFALPQQKHGDFLHRVVHDGTDTIGG